MKIKKILQVPPKPEPKKTVRVLKPTQATKTTDKSAEESAIKPEPLRGTVGNSATKTELAQKSPTTTVPQKTAPSRGKKIIFCGSSWVANNPVN